jgi:hypothetical protein
VPAPPMPVSASNLSPSKGTTMILLPCWSLPKSRV